MTKQQPSSGAASRPGMKEGSMVGTNRRSNSRPKNITLAGRRVGKAISRRTSPCGLRHKTTPPSQIAVHRLPSASTVAPSGIGPQGELSKNGRRPLARPVSWS
jgi:hypothetical protein